MRKKFATFLANPGRLLSLLLIQTFVALAVPFVDGRVTNILDISKIGKISGGTPLVKPYQLQSGCSNRFIQMAFNKSINALALKDAPMARLNFMSDPSGSGSIRIKGSTVAKYLCFSRTGRLINRTNTGGSPRCFFYEEPHRNYIKLQSVANPKWYVGFRKNGKKLKGYARKDRWMREKCFMFIKMDFNETKQKPKTDDVAFVEMVDRMQKSQHSQDKYQRQR